MVETSFITAPTFLTGADLLARQLETGDDAALDALQTELGADSSRLQTLRESVNTTSVATIADKIRRDAFVWNQILAGKKMRRPAEPEIEYPGRYKILDRIWKSAHHDLWLAFDPVSKNIVVVKALSPESHDRLKADLHLRSEFELGRRLEHPAIIQYLDWGNDFVLATEGREEEWRRPYLVMEYLGRMNLRMLFKKRDALLSWEEAREIFLQILAGLEALHQAGFVHCDIKPRNIIVAELGERIAVKLIDFGFAVETGRSVEQGTPSYISPEQIRYEPVDRRTDIYSVGVMLFEMLTGSLPFYAKTRWGLFRLHQFQFPSFFQQIRPGLQLPADAEKIVRKALNKKPKDRFQSAAEMAEAIRRCK